MGGLRLVQSSEERDMVTSGNSESVMKATNALLGIIIITLSQAVPVRAQSFLTNGLVVYYPFNGNAKDASGNGNDGTVDGAVLTADRFGHANSAYSFNGTNSDILVPETLFGATNQAWTISVWITLDSGPYVALTDIYAKSSVNGEMDLITATNSVQVVIKTASEAYYYASAPLVTNSTIHMVGVYQKGQSLSLYINGVLRDSTPVPNENLWLAAYPLISALGAYHLPPTPFDCFRGTVDDFRVYTRALSASEVQQLYQYESTSQCVSPPAGLVSWWPGEGNANDIVGANNGTLVNGASFAPGIVGQAFSFDGISGYVRIADSPSLHFTNAMTVEAWVYPTSLGANQAVVSKWDLTVPGAQKGYTTWVQPDGLIGLGVCDDGYCWQGAGQASATVVSTNPLPANQWTHFAATYDGSALRIYVNGVYENQTAYTNGMFPGTGDLRLGCAVPNGGAGVLYPFAGRIDEPSLYNRALSSAEIQAIFAAGSAGKCEPGACVSPPLGLVSWWPGEGDANDIVGTNSGTLSGGVTFTNGEVGQAFSVNGTTQGVIIPYSGTLAASNYSVEAWVKPLAQVSGGIGQDLVVGQDYGWQLVARTGTSGVSIAFLFATSPVSFYSVVSASNIPLGQFSHLVGTWDGTTLRLYVNGVLNAQNVPGASPVDSGYPFCIGGFYNSGQYFNGLIDEISYYGRALSGGEAQTLYNAGSAGKCRSALPSRAAAATASVASGFVVGVNITDGGYGYTNTPIVRVIGGGGSGAQAVAVVSNEVVIAVNILDAGSGYTNTPVIVIDPPFVAQPTMAIGTASLLTFTNLALGPSYQLEVFSSQTWSNLDGAFTATNSTFAQYVPGMAGPYGYRLSTNPKQAYATAQVLNGFVIGATVTSGGSGYGSNVVVTIVGGGGTNATAVAMVSGGAVTGITITDAGSGYTGTPSIIIAPPPAIGLWPAVTSAVELDLGSLSPYDNYQLEFAPVLGEAWSNVGNLFTPTATTSTQYLNASGNAGFFRASYVP